ncbi:phosphatidylethanolamine/phosphatidyl-N-methylethanolamine N-methyltransferase [Breoghania corrubedonensis]|uniref:Phosphatidylethanolamine/phosphatidyl-N-methylethanolamine N-methyltransferase n=1 Tax=Breoghania corrubedonensis TaxID=665038 RepID=A0A2T5VGE3_9HYPH|nr:rRNA adenine N-6-methyltransferase family protein [Breoghania corrubedonensis]PTW62786.1 phosphatidylethanolamine/phosphatidyl-N-methylethanolamine N-methyltransferase [Breoghania corrubedonensis]
MNHPVAVRAKRFSSKILDEARFIRSWVENPMKTGAVSPSGPALSKLMASQAEPERKGPILELGPGTGVVTKALVDRGIDQNRLVALEYNPDFCLLLHRRFPALAVVQGDAYALSETLKGTEAGSLASIVSSLPLFSRPPAERRELLIEALDLLEPGAPFIQFSYALVPPVPAEPGLFTVSRSPWVLMNLPPARVWVYRKA